MSPGFLAVGSRWVWLTGSRAGDWGRKESEALAAIPDSSSVSPALPTCLQVQVPFPGPGPPRTGGTGGRRVTGPTAPSPRTLLLLWFPYTLVKSLLTNFKFAQIHCAIDFLLGLNEYNSKCRISILLIFF